MHIFRKVSQHFNDSDLLLAYSKYFDDNQGKFLIWIFGKRLAKLRSKIMLNNKGIDYERDLQEAVQLSDKPASGFPTSLQPYGTSANLEK